MTSTVLLGRLLGFLLLGTFTGLLARRKGLNPWAWGAAGGLFFPLVLVVMAFMPFACKTCGARLTGKRGTGRQCPACTNQRDLTEDPLRTL